MEHFTKLFGDVLAFVYQCFDRIVILGHLPLLTRPENIVHFFRDVHGVGAMEIRPDYLILRVRQPGGPPHERALEAIRNFGESVIPRL